VKLCPTCGREFPDNVKFCPNDGQTLRAKAASADLIGQVVADRYHILKKLGEGGMGAVYLGEHVKMGRKSAIKVMAAAMSQDPDAISRFNREASNASRISHPNVCQIYDFGETPDGLIYLAMEFIEGQSLKDIVEREGALPAVRAANITRQAADALQAAHDLGIVHRDIKPDNIMIVQGRDGSDIVKVVDFGIARAVGGDEPGQKVTKTGLVVGTPEYMSPEQLSGDKLDGRSDVYSLALVLYRMLTGVLPFQADSAQETMIKRLTDDPLPLAETRPDVEFPPKLQLVLNTALARMAAERYQSAADFGRDTMDAVAGMPMPSTRVGPAPEGATHIMSKHELTEATKAQAPRRTAPPARTGETAAARSPAPARRSMLVPVLGGVGGVGALAVVAFLMMNKNKPQPNPVAQDSSSQQVAMGGDSSKAPAPGNQRPNTTPVNTQSTHTNPGNPGTNPGTTPGTTTTPANPPAPAAPSWDDSLRVANDAYDADMIDRARALGSAIYASAGASPSAKARAAVLVATTYANSNDLDHQLQWYRNALRYDPNNQRVRQAIIDLGGQP